mmetsp:Transcript_25346/g.63752  ORF Transcript_25346/g.63752 Transcript_25346/m.63752 type:complete len:535 (-) Transcript_25346:14-1618(-)
MTQGEPADKSEMGVPAAPPSPTPEVEEDTYGGRGGAFALLGFAPLKKAAPQPAEEEEDEFALEGGEAGPGGEEEEEAEVEVEAEQEPGEQAPEGEAEVEVDDAEVEVEAEGEEDEFTALFAEAGAGEEEAEVEVEDEFDDDGEAEAKGKKKGGTKPAAKGKAKAAAAPGDGEEAGDVEVAVEEAEEEDDDDVGAAPAGGKAGKGKAKGKGKPLDADCNGKGSWNGPGAIVGFTGWGEDPPMQGGKCGLSAGKGPGGDCGFGGDWGLAAWEKGCGKTGWGPPVGAWPEWDWRWDDGSKGWGRGPPWEPRAASGSPPVSKGACPGGPGRPGATGLVPPTPCRSASGKGVAGKKSQVEMPGVTDRRFWGMVKSCGKEFGFIICNDLIEHFGKDDIYVHATNLEGYQAGDAVTFAIIVNEQWKPQAVTLQPAVADAGNARKRPRVENGGLAMGVTSGTKSAVEVPGVTDRRFVGHVKSRGREYGFLLCEELSQFFGQNDVFVHTNNLANFKVGDGASFVVLVNDKGKPQAADLRPEGG